MHTGTLNENVVDELLVLLMNKIVIPNYWPVTNLLASAYM